MNASVVVRAQVISVDASAEMVVIPDSASDWEIGASFGALRWYAAYTSANHEKRVAEQLRVRGIEHFLPLYESVRRWRDRRMRLKLPLFPGYVFVRMALRDRIRLLQVPGVVNLVGCRGVPAALQEAEIEALRTSLAGGMQCKPHLFLTVGRRVRIARGPLTGVEGVLRQQKGSVRLILSVELIRRSFIVNVDKGDVQPLEQ